MEHYSNATFAEIVMLAKENPRKYGAFEASEEEGALTIQGLINRTTFVTEIAEDGTFTVRTFAVEGHEEDRRTKLTGDEAVRFFWAFREDGGSTDLPQGV